MALFKSPSTKRAKFNTVLRHYDYRSALFFILLISHISCQENPCKSKMTCSACITASGQCGWLKKEDSNISPDKRCQIADKNSPKNEWINPRPTIDLVKDENLSEPKAAVNKIVQLRPQEVSIQLRINTPQKLTVKFRQAEDYPVDLYFLMDLSNSMKDDKAKLAELGQILGTSVRESTFQFSPVIKKRTGVAMNNITKNYRLGFGSFVDKKAAPYVSIHPAHLANPCFGCAPPYSFINHMPLEKDLNKFVDEVSRSSVSSNLDTPEGGFDAIMQVAVCHQQIQWRNVSRKILLFATDAGFHYAGDGKLAGIVNPNDELCHLDVDGNYAESVNMDYPSISQINKKVAENRLNVIFAASGLAFYIYEDLQKMIEGSSVDRLADSSTNIVDLIQKQYKQITSNVELKHTAPNNVIVTFYSRCLDPKMKKKTNQCKQLKMGDQIEFDVYFEVNQCPADPKNRDITFDISPVGLGESLTVRLQLLCDCDCEKKINSTICSDLGTLECGVCNCPKGKFGQFCQCQNQVSAGTTDDSKCKMTPTSIPCSARGYCKCDQCICHKQQDSERHVYGAYCECDDFSCLSSGGLICGGPERGTCECGKCICAPGWTGEACDCKSTDELCYGQNGDLCSNIGNCTCGECKCPFENEGQFCEKKSNPAGKCYDYQLCAQCSAFKDENPQLDCEKCEEKNFQVVEKAEILNPGEYRCSFKDDDGCHYYFVYSQSNEGNDAHSPTRVQKTKECPKPPDVLMIVAAVVGSVVAIGLCLLLIWKILTSIYDKREYSKFLKDLDKAKWDKVDNPIYREAKTTFANPMYNPDTT